MKISRKAEQRNWKLAEDDETLSYLEIDLKERAKTIAKKLVEGVNIPGTQKPMPVDSSSLPEGWKKYVIQKKMPNEKSKWSVFFSHESTRKWFSCKDTLVRYLEKENLISNIKVESFDFTVPKDLRKIINIWKRCQIRNSKRKQKRLAKKLKENVPHPIPYEIEWSILAHSKPFDPVTGVCRLCLLEAYFIMFDPEDCTLNTREEFWGSCPHRKKFLLINQKG